MADIAREIATHKALVEWLRAAFPDADDQTISDTAEGESTLSDAILAALREAIEREAHAKALGELIDDMAARKRRLENNAHTLRNAALMAMDQVGMQKLAGPDMTASICKGRPKVVIIDEDAIPDEFVRVVREPDKKKIAERIKNFGATEWARFGNAAPILTLHRR